MSIENETQEFDVNALFNKNNSTPKKEEKKQNQIKYTQESDNLIDSIRQMKENLLNGISFESLSTKIPIIAIGYFNSLNEITGFAVEIDKTILNVYQIIYGPFYTKVALQKWIEDMKNNIFVDEKFIYLEIYALSTFIDNVGANAINEKIKDEELDIGTMNYDDRHISILKNKLK